MKRFYNERRERHSKDGKHDKEAWVPIVHDIDTLREWEKKRVMEVAVCNDPQVSMTASDDVNINKFPLCKSPQFENNFSLRLAKNIIECGYSELRNVQKTALPFLKAGCHMVLATCGASGKTNAYLFPMLQRVLDDLKKTPHQRCHPRAIVICSSKDQAKYLLDRTVAFTHGLGVNVALMFSQMTVGAFKDRDDADILFTSAFILEQAINGNRITFEHMKYFVVDGIDDAFKEWQFSPQSMVNVIEMVESLRTGCQIVLVADDYSALEIDFFKERINNKESLVVLENEHQQRIPPGNHYLARVREQDLDKATVKMIKSCDEGFSMVVISRVGDTLKWARNLGKVLEKERISYAIYHTEMPMSERDLLLTNACNGRFQVLIAPFCCQLRGIRFPGLRQLIHLAPPWHQDEHYPLAYHFSSRATAFMPRARSVVFFNVDRNHQAGQNVKEIGEIIRASTPNCAWPENTLAPWVMNAMKGSQTEWTVDDLLAADKFEDFNQPDHYYWKRSLDQDSSSRSGVSPTDVVVGPPPGFESSAPGYNHRADANYEVRRPSDSLERDFGRQRGYSDEEDEDSSYDSQLPQQGSREEVRHEDHAPRRYSEMRPQQQQSREMLQPPPPQRFDPRNDDERYGREQQKNVPLCADCASCQKPIVGGAQENQGNFRGQPENYGGGQRGYGSAQENPSNYRGAPQEDFPAYRGQERSQPNPSRERQQMENFSGRQQQQDFYNNRGGRQQGRYNDEDYGNTEDGRFMGMPPPPHQGPPGPPLFSSGRAPVPPRESRQEWDSHGNEIRRSGPPGGFDDYNKGYRSDGRYMEMPPSPPPSHRGPPGPPQSYRRPASPDRRDPPFPHQEHRHGQPLQEWSGPSRFGDENEFRNMPPSHSRRGPPGPPPQRSLPSSGRAPPPPREAPFSSHEPPHHHRHSQQQWDGHYGSNDGYRDMPPPSNCGHPPQRRPASPGRGHPRDAPPFQQRPEPPQRQENRQRPQEWNGPRQNEFRDMAPCPPQSSRYATSAPPPREPRFPSQESHGRVAQDWHRPEFPESSEASYYDQQQNPRSWTNSSSRNPPPRDDQWHQQQPMHREGPTDGHQQQNPRNRVNSFSNNQRPREDHWQQPMHREGPADGHQMRNHRGGPPMPPRNSSGRGGDHRPPSRNHGRRSPAFPPPPSQGRRSPAFTSERPPSRGRGRGNRGFHQNQQSGVEKKFGSMDIREQRGENQMGPRREGGPPHQQNRQKAAGAPSNFGGQRPPHPQDRPRSRNEKSECNQLPSSSEARNKPQKPNIVVGPHFKERHQKKRQMKKEEEQRLRDEKANDGKKEDVAEEKNEPMEKAPSKEEPPIDVEEEKITDEESPTSSDSATAAEKRRKEYILRQRELNNKSKENVRSGTGNMWKMKDLMEVDPEW